MKASTAAVATGIIAAFAGLAGYANPLQLQAARAPRVTLAEMARMARVRTRPPTISPDTLTAVVHRVCGECHNDGVLAGELSLETFDVANAAKSPVIAEKMIAKLRTGMMPLPGYHRPAGDTLIFFLPKRRAGNAER